ncbi:MAG TPA: cbb3-type cytochrome c oxidase subunit I, partial [Ramlibacter sp.]|nr:cbb3-type cytochrome c oxidase subunit I [Ramlibacter sp.]
GTVWGHGSYVAPDWSADWLHREAVALQAILARKLHVTDESSTARRAGVEAAMREQMRANTYNSQAGTITVTPERAQAIREVAQHYEALYGNDPSLAKLRGQYAMREDALANPQDRKDLTAFFFWTSWAASTDRPGETDLSYTSNWPHDELVGNTMTSSAAVWSMVSIVLLLGGIAAMLWLHGGAPHEEQARAPNADPLFSVVPTPSMKSTRKYFFAVAALILVQIGMGAITAHYAVEGESFFGLPLAQVLPYVVSRTIHTQLGIFWIATAWLATGLYIAPLLSGKEPKLQKLGVDVLFWALIAIVVGSTAFGWLGTLQERGVDFSFWLGNQGLEYTSMGRIWQYLLFVGLLFWVFLLGRALWPPLVKPSESRGLIAMV